MPPRLFLPGGGAAEVTQPTLSVAGRADGEAYTVTAGARSLSITAQSGATLLTTVEQASTGASVTVTGATTTTPSWTAPSGSTVGEACNVLTVATLDGLTSHVGWTEYTAGSGGGGGSGGSWSTLLDLDFTGVTSAGPYTTGTNTLTIGGDTIDLTVTRFSGATGSVTPTNGTGLVFSANGPGTLTAAWDFVAQLAQWDRAAVSQYVHAVHIVCDAVAMPSVSDSIMGGVSTNTTHNSGDSRVFYSTADGTGPTTERWRTRNNTNNSANIATAQTARTSRVITAIVIGGAIVEVMDTAGTTLPTPAPGGASTYTVGADAVGQLDTSPQYLSCYCVLNVAFGTSLTVTRILVQRYE